MHAEAGERIVCLLPGGGGVGPARERDPRLVARDVDHGYVSPESARDEYGVVLAPGTTAVDARATRSLREPPRED
jgi:N-methylhydantoinase B